MQTIVGDMGDPDEFWTGVLIGIALGFTALYLSRKLSEYMHVMLFKLELALI